jgi:hypothetical protein
MFGLARDPEYLKFRESISSLARLSAETGSSNIESDNFEVPKSSDSYEMWSQKILVIFEAMGLYKVFVIGLDLSPLTSA